MRRYLDISAHALVLSAFLALAFTGSLGMVTVVSFIAAVLWSLFRTVQQRPLLLGSSSTFYLSLAFCVFFIADNLFFSRSFVPATVHMVLFLLITKLLLEKSERDYFYIVVLAFLMILAAASLTVDFSFFVALLFFLISLVATLMSFEIFRSQLANPGSNAQVGGSLTGISVWASAWIVFAGVGLFFVIPRMGTGYFSRTDGPLVLLTGYSDNVRLGDIGKIKASSAVVMHAQRVSGKPSSGLKWRGIALDRFDGSMWHKTDPRRELMRRTDNGVYAIQPLENENDAVRYDILLEPIATATLFAPYRVRSVNYKQDPIMTDRDESIFIRTPLPHRIQYQVLSEIPIRRNASDSLTLENTAPYLQLPEDLDPRVIILSHDITKGKVSPLEKASQIEAHLRKNYHYTLNLTWTPGPRPISTFLFEARNGHCEYFASAMALLMRAAGIPTRLINGFQMGEFNPVGSDYIVRESDAHSWVEAFIPGQGWMEFDPTPPDMRPAATGILEQIRHYVDAIELQWSTYILIYDAESQSQLFHSAQDQLQSLQSDLRNGTDYGSKQVRTFAAWLARVFQNVSAVELVLVSLLVAGGITAACYQRTLRMRWQIWKFRSGRGTLSRDLVEYLLLRAARLADLRKEQRVPAQTWREWAGALPDANRRSILLGAIGVFEKSRYGCEPVSASDFAILENAIRDLRG